jgi:hypothetical protein
MKKLVYVLVCCMFVFEAGAIVPSGRGRNSMASQMMGSPRAGTVSRNQISAMAATNNPYGTNGSTGSALAVTPEVMLPADKDIYQAEKDACVRNNIGMSDTFVWASRYSNLNSYSSMVEDTETPSNNTCFIKVALKSRDSKINLDDLPTKYYEMGNSITCGSWVDEKQVEQKILDAKKSGRVWGTIGASVAGAGVGVGVMEWFGNEMIGGAVQGQAALTGTQLIRAQLLTMKEKGDAQYNAYMTDLRKIKEECTTAKYKEKSANSFVGIMCREYEGLFDLVNSTN